MLLDFNKTLASLIEEMPEFLDFLLLNGFKELKNPQMLKTLGKSLTLKKACKLKNIEPLKLRADFNAWKGENIMEADTTLNKKERVANTEATVLGILPCPIRIPLMESFEEFIKSNALENVIGYDLRSANLGLDWIEDELREISDTDKLPDMLMSAGFNLFFDYDLVGRHTKSGIYKVPPIKMNKRFTDYEINLYDDTRAYHIIGVVPAVFIVNTKALGDREIPKSWADLLSDDFIGSVAVPMNDLDLFNAIIINIHETFGMEGVRKLGRAYASNLHPAQMVKKAAPVVSIAPYFFATMAPEGGPMKCVWPEEGAAASPIFLITKQEKLNTLKPVLDFFTSKDISEIYSASGKFPCTNEDIEHVLELEKKLLFPSWETLLAENFTTLLKSCEEEFFKYSNDGSLN